MTQVLHRGPAAPPRLRVELQPTGRRVDVEAGSDLLSAVQAAAVGIVAVCGGHGACGSCKVRVVRGDLAPPTDAERSLLGPGELAGGFRLACQARVLSDCTVGIPEGSLSASQRLAFEGGGVAVGADTPVLPVDVEVEPPGLGDLRSDAARLLDAIAATNGLRPEVDVPVLAQLPTRLRAEGWSVRAVVSQPERGLPRLVGVLPPGTEPLGLAVDLGTTKLAAYLVSMESGTTLAQAGAMNPQIAFGEDVMSRITRANESPANARLLRDSVVEALGSLVEQLCAQSGRSYYDIVDAVVVGNTAMHHLLLGLPVRQLGEAPYVPAASDPVEAPAASIGLRLNPGAPCYLPPNIAGFVGADHVAMVLAAGLGSTERTVLGLDIGTNTEISLSYRGHLRSCSTASGPAFEGARIRQGMRAAPGAVEHVRYVGDRFLVQTVDNAPAIGICGSGILDAVAEARKAGVLDSRGALSRQHPLVSRSEHGPSCLLVGADQAGNGRDIFFTRSDVNEIQLAKGAVRAGTKVLLAEAGITEEALDEVVMAGAFGTYLDVGSAVAIGMLPAVPLDRYRQIGNGAGRGAVEMLVSRDQRSLAREVAKRSEYIELTVYPGFVDIFADSLPL